MYGFEGTYDDVYALLEILIEEHIFSVVVLDPSDTWKFRFQIPQINHPLQKSFSIGIFEYYRGKRLPCVLRVQARGRDNFQRAIALANLRTYQMNAGLLHPDERPTESANSFKLARLEDAR